MNVLAYVLDTARTNINTLWNEMNPTKKLLSYDLMWTLAEELIKPFIQHRFENRVGLAKHIVVAMANQLGVQDYTPAAALNQVAEANKSQCYYCLADIHGKPGYKKLKDKLGKFRFVCSGDECAKTVCHNHMKLYCHPCADKLVEE